MNNFGVIELAGAKTTSAPGWAYVPDTRLAAQQAASTTTTNRKRARNAPGGGLTLSDLTARQETKARKELETLDRDGGRDATIPLPGKSGRTQGKHTANVRKILQSQKTFANHLDDFLALQALNEANAAAAAAAASKRSGAAARNKDISATPGGDTPMPDVGEGSAADDGRPSTLLAAPHRPPPAAHPGDTDPLLVSRVPPLPTDAEMRRLLAAPPLSYGEARGNWAGGEGRGQRPAPRGFCEVCGYWGRVRCLKCGTRVCALDCLETHREECVTRYGI
ncbi:Zinc finger, HIT-type [Cordyceps fumosorosea ARSEF 2679]|uniref:Zinc finger, HIT-type n=1 Tax=Cordyceps fumosorosea (strain ARSEF 2679) TaxID=1081104 RepID=A0A167XI84_CORFA|nr:Zinc finger, HIT-type [Cordyceps fumosorosea ARSEF 2679]OAA65004.1 Zinc finger, HIT-type [Cordyceps fumosorosea ARSEF 2679]